MSYLLFLDESGHDHRTMPYEVRGGVALHASELWPFVQDMQCLELASFGTTLHQFQAELKGCTLLDKDRFKWAAQESPVPDEERRKHCRYRSAWIVPAPFFVSSDMTYPVQAADLAIYCVNWGFRLPTRGMDALGRPEIADDYGRWITQLRFRGEAHRDGAVYDSYGIVFVPDPYGTK
jgi:hypothetical protein